MMIRGEVVPDHVWETFDFKEVTEVVAYMKEKVTAK